MTTEWSCPIMASSWLRRPGRDSRDAVDVRRLPAIRAVWSRPRAYRRIGDVPPASAPQLGSLTWLPAADRPDLLGAPVAAALPLLGGAVWVAEIDDALAD